MMSVVCSADLMFRYTRTRQSVNASRPYAKYPILQATSCGLSFATEEHGGHRGSRKHSGESSLAGPLQPSLFLCVPCGERPARSFASPRRGRVCSAHAVAAAEVAPMMNAIWVALVVASIVTAAFTGRMEAVSNASIDSAKSAVTLALGLIGVMAFWLGLMRVVQEG